MHIRAVRTRLLHLLQNIFPPYNQPHARTKATRETVASKGENVTRETFELSHHTFCSQSEKEGKAKIPEHLPNTLDQATKQSHC